MDITATRTANWSTPVSVTTVTATGTAAVDSPEAAFDVITPIDLSLVFTGWGPLPAITHVEEQSGPWDHVGVLIGPMWKRYMRKGLAASIREVERAADVSKSTVD